MINRFKLLILSIFAIFFFSETILAQRIKGEVLLGKTVEEQFGRNVKLSNDGNTMAIAAPLNSDFSDQNGRITVYKYLNNKWEQIGNDIFPSGNGYKFGEIMELSSDGNTLIVPSSFQKINFYTFNGIAWEKSKKNITLENEYDYIKAISITNDLKKIAVTYDNSKLYSNCIKIFKHDTNGWMQEGTTILPESSKKSFGNAISLSSEGNFIVVGNSFANSNGLKYNGEITIYKLIYNNWVKTESSFTGRLAEDSLGSSLVVSNDGKTIIASSNDSDDILNKNAGYVEIYELINNNWVKNKQIIKPEMQNPFFGHSLALSHDGNVLALSLPYLGFKKPGYVKVYKKTNNNWLEFATITDVNGVETTSFPNNSTGWSIDISSDGKTLAIGFPHNDENGDMSGKVIVYDLNNLE